MDLKVIQRDPITQKISFSFGKNFEFIDGIEELIQIFIINLYSIPGKNIFFPNEGGGVLELLGSNVDLNDKTSLISAIKQMIEKTKNEIMERQENIENKELKLKNVTLYHIDNGFSSDEIEITIQIENEKGQMTKFIF